MKTHTLFSGLLLALVVPTQVMAYTTPQELFLLEYLPPTAREAQERVRMQTRTSAERREYEQSQLEYHAPENVQQDLDTELYNAAPVDENAVLPQGVRLEDILSEEDLSLLNAVRLLDNREKRLLDRVQSNQYEIEYYRGRLHGGAPPLAPTGAGGILAALTIIGAVLWTIYSVKKAEGQVKTLVK